MLVRTRALPDPLPCLGASSPLLNRLYAARGVRAPAELELGLSHLLPMQDMKGLDAAVTLLVEALRARKRLLLIGDFDADGATATAVAVLALRSLGAGSVDYLVPNRFEFGYGLTPEIVAVAREFTPDLIITVDNGIASLDGVAAAQAAGIEVLVTDHHLPGSQLPQAAAIVNPNQADCGFPSKSMAGVGVIFYVMLALRARLRAEGWFAEQSLPEPNLAELLDLVALGTVADVVPLDANNRILVHQGLMRIRAGKARPGLLALLEVAGRNRQEVAARDLGFILGPRLNAAGRLDDMRHGIACLLCEDPEQAAGMARELDQLNQERKQIEQGMQQEALAELQSLDLDGAMPLGLCVYQPEWHQGVIGILAARLRERYHRPVIAFAGADAGTLKGSARSIPGLHVRDALDAVATRHPGLISRFGGHAMAAGLSLPETHLADFTQAFADEVARQLTAEDLEEVVLTDGPLADAEFSLETAQTLCTAGPWGQHFPEPSFHGTFVLQEQRLLKERHLKLKVRTDEGRLLEAIAFNVDRSIWPNAGIRQVQLVYQLDVNRFRGQESLQLLVRHLAPLED